VTKGPEKTREKTRSNVASEVGLETVNESKGGRGNYERMQVLKTKTVMNANAMQMMP